jgi:hypothetical protein
MKLNDWEWRERNGIDGLWIGYAVREILEWEF